MNILLKNANLYNPNYQGVKDILISNNHIAKIDNNIKATYKEINCKGKIVCPSFVDGHEHLLGDYYSIEGIKSAGVSCVIGVLANEPNSSYVDSLLEKVKQLNSNGINAYCLAGSKNYTENIEQYILNNDCVIGVKSALFQPQRPKPNLSYEKLKNDAITVYNASIKSNKTLQLHLHLDHPFKRGEMLSIDEIDSGKYDNLDWIDKIVEETNVPYSLFKLTHAQKYYNRILEYANKGCYIDYTAFHSGYDKRFDCLVTAIKNKTIDLSKISISSDLGIRTLEEGLKEEEKPSSFLHTFVSLVNYKDLSIEDTLKMITINPASLISKNLGKIYEGGKANILILDENLNIEKID